MKLDSTMFKNNVAAILFYEGLTLKELAKAIGMPYSTFYYQFHHLSAMSEETVNKIADYLGITAKSLKEDIHAWPSDASVREVLKTIGDSEGFAKENGYGEMTIPFIPQKISAGYGEEIFNVNDAEIKTINIMQDLARGVPRDSLLAARVKGDSMIDVYIYPDDIVVFANGIISGDGIYVLSIDNEVMVKRLVFDRLTHSVLIISENKKYPQREAKDDNQSLRILGKVVGWIHANSV